MAGQSTTAGQDQGGNAQGGNAQGGTPSAGNAQGASAGQGQAGAAQGGNAQGGNAQGGNAQSGNAQGGNAQGGSPQGGNAQGGIDVGGASGAAPDDCCGNPTDPCGWIGDGICQEAGFCSWGKDPDCVSGGGAGGGGTLDLTVRGTGFGSGIVRAWVLDASDALLGASHQPVEGGSFTLSWPALLQPSNEGYRIRYFLDANGDGVCAGAEQEATIVTGTVISSREYDVTATSPAATACQPAPTGSALRLSGAGFAVPNGTLVRARVARQGTTDIVATGSTTTKDSAFTMSWPALLQASTSYEVSYSLDTVANGVCDTTGDQGGTFTVKGGVGDVSLDALPSASPSEACGAFKKGSWNLLVHGKKFVPADGATVRLQVFRGEASTDVIRQATVVKGEFEIAIEGALDGEGTYSVGYFLDTDQDSVCTPASEPAWYLDLGVPAGDISVEVLGDTTQNPAGCWIAG